METRADSIDSSQYLIPNTSLGELEDMFNNSNEERAAIEQDMVNNDEPHQSSIPDKQVARTESFSNKSSSQQLSASNKGAFQAQSQHLPAQNKRAVQMENISSKSLTPNKRNVQMEQSPKSRSEPVEAVRSKMRESLAASLALTSQEQDKSPNTGKNSQIAASEDGYGRSLENSQSNDQPTSSGIFSCENSEDFTQALKCNGREFQLNPVFPIEDVSFSDSFFVKDELLQGNGLSWAVDVDMEAGDAKEIQTAKRPKLEHEGVGFNGQKQAAESPKTLAFKIEAELFKLFGGVNKKYKEKGRSLLFNLKDRNNPELRERVISGEISPERLCSMTAEELASKELSQWRIAKAEEFASMVVLPDSEVDIRRLVKKTHKGEFQVEVERDDSVSVEVSVGSTSLSQIRPKANDKEANPSPTPAGAKEVKASITIDGNDPMQGLVVDELKDVDFLPPIVSLDEFMESLDTEPPFANLPVDSGKRNSISERETSQVKSEMKLSDLALKDPNQNRVDVVKQDKHDLVNEKNAKLDASVKSIDSHLERKSSPAPAIYKGDHIWEGVLQLNISATTTLIGFYKSGEKASTNQWPGFLDVKGRVRLDAFEKFIQELHMSRSRAIMVVHFVLKEGSSDSEHTSLSEVVDSYVLEDRLGFAEPTSGVELYLCPPNMRTLDILSKHLPKDHRNALNAINNGLIGVAVWRKPHITPTRSPNSSSNHKHSSRKQHNTTTTTTTTVTTINPVGRRQEEKDSKNLNANIPLSNRIVDDNDDDIDDIPPGFGPGSARVEDDLPEFEFSGGTTPKLPRQNYSHESKNMTHFQIPSQKPSRPVQQMRELIQKYGQTGTSDASIKIQGKKDVGVPLQGWNDDDEDDDIPEWQPEALPNRLQPQPLRLPVDGLRQYLVPPPPSQTVHPVLPLRPPMNAPMHPQNAAFYSTRPIWRPDNTPRGRGF